MYVGQYKDPFHIEALRFSGSYSKLLAKHLFLDILQGPWGACHLAMWMITGQGYKTISFLDLLPAGKFHFTDLDQAVHFFWSHRTSPISNMSVWGSPNKYLGIILPKSPDDAYNVIHDKLSPCWSPSLAEKWAKLLADNKPLSWAKVHHFISSSKILGLGSGLTAMHFVHNVRYFGLCQPATLEDIQKILDLSALDKGAAKGLEILGYNHQGNKRALQENFADFHTALSSVLGNNLKEQIMFCPGVTENLLCKLLRINREWNNIFSKLLNSYFSSILLTGIQAMNNLESTAARIFLKHGQEIIQTLST